jgi:hypothetical protein
VVNTLDEMANAVELVPRISRRRCREWVEQHFDVPRMVDDYLRAYERVLSEAGVRREHETGVAVKELAKHTVDYSVDIEGLRTTVGSAN